MKFINTTNETLHFNGLPAWEAGKEMEVIHEGLIYAFENNSHQVKPLWLHKQEQKETGKEQSKTYLDTAQSVKLSNKKTPKVR